MMRPYSILLLNNAFVDISSATASILCISRLIFLRDGHSEVYVFIGPCTLVGGWFCQLLQTIHTYFVSHSTVILLHSFCFRLYLLRDNGTQASVSARATILISLVSYFPTLLMMSMLFISINTSQHVRFDLIIYYWFKTQGLPISSIRISLLLLLT
ncbi:hypothetical protein PMAYCL1PPCAC_17481 [Pristionchus mayeri]|uniref:G protein-coupled receptor n=1 Tax=Pristionchus mayeri TaxID=1317129 RepID=A0AAN5CMQ2_9BILA|nr:hypothetical protein PMAYCL1PPCAC_17481 [Pristionchus mayeri]